MNPPTRLVVLGSTGSVGRQTLSVARTFPERFQVVGLGAGSNAELLAAQAEEFDPLWVAVADPAAAGVLRQRLGPRWRDRVVEGPEALSELAGLPEADVVVAAVVGQAGLAGVAAAARAGKRIALANKEALVMAGEVVVSLVRDHGAELVPVDSEHASLAQLLEPLDPGIVRRVVLTASGGPFLRMPVQQLAGVRPEQALAHPKWQMGAKISIDSATMMNKGFEVIEARWLFDLAPERIGVLIHPQSLVHALVELHDGAWLAHLGPADMRLPIAWALGRPDRLPLGERLDGFDWLDLAAGELSFQPASQDRWPALRLCRQALGAGGGCAAALAVADEVLVGAYLQGRIGFLDVTGLAERVLERFQPRPLVDITSVVEAGAEGGRLATALVGHR